MRPVRHRRRLDARRRAPGVDDERDQRAHLAVAGRDRHHGPALWDQTVAVAIEADIIPEAPPDDAYRTDLAEAALDDITELTRRARTSRRGPSRSPRAATSHPARPTTQRAGPRGPARLRLPLAPGAEPHGGRSALDPVRGDARTPVADAAVRSRSLPHAPLPAHAWPIRSDFAASSRTRRRVARVCRSALSALVALAASRAR